MGLPELKQKIQLQIENADERLLRIVSSVFDNYLNENIFVEKISEPIVAFDTSGKSLNLKEYNEEIDKGIDDFKNGKSTTQEALLEEIKSWQIPFTTP